MESENVHTYYMLNHQMRNLLFHSFHFLVFWLLMFENLYGLISEHSTLNMFLKKENNRKETI